MGAAWRRLRWLLRAGFLTDALLILLLVWGALAVALIAHENLLTQQRVQVGAKVLPPQLIALRSSLQAMAPQQREAFLASMDRLTHGDLARDDPSGTTLSEPTGYVAAFAETLHRVMPGVTIMAATQPHATMWLRMSLGGPQEQWLRFRAPSLREAAPGLALWLLVLASFLSMLGAAFVTMRLRRRLGWVGKALEMVDVDTMPGRADSVPGQQPTHEDSLRLDERFLRLSDRLAQAHQERSLAVASVATELSEQIERLSRLQAGAGAARSGRTLGDIERTVAQLQAFALGPQHEIPQRLDLIDLLREALASSERPPGAGPALALATDAGEPIFVVGVAQGLRRLFANLLDNAERHGGGAVEIQVSLDPDGVLVAVQDRGPGATPQELSLILRPFYRTEAARARGVGGGVGLAMANDIALAHGGSLKVAARDGGGLRVEVRLPQAIK
ncbi:MAG TPA: HAMP domain-containing sensor histidine kinase [Ramlibacter sp.]|nr:HAMP domain-containing sensor histidine kinase [Ramlibacter sp.]